MSKRIWLLVAALAACVDTHGPQTGTQTGNPPVLDRGRVTLEVSADEVHITGKPGAATPGGATIEITNLSSGDVTEGMAAANGSFDVRVDGSLDDTFVVRVVANGLQSDPVYVVRGGAEIPDNGKGSLSCGQYRSLASAVLEASTSSADRSCDSADDCKPVIINSSCASACSLAYLTAAGERQLEATLSELEGGLCAMSAEDGCWYPMSMCPTPGLFHCDAGQCAARAQGSCEEHAQKIDTLFSEAIAAADTRCEEDSDCVLVPRANLCQLKCGSLAIAQTARAQLEAATVGSGACETPTSCPTPSILCEPEETYVPRCQAGQCTKAPETPDGGTPNCTTCISEALAWSWNGGFVPYDDLSELIPCARYKHRRAPRGSANVDEASCESDFVACNAITSTGAVLSALDNADVQRALGESPVLYGTDPRGVDGQVFRITLGDKMIEVGGSCLNAPPNCIPAPEGVARLARLLQDIDETMLSTEECADFPR